MCKRANTSFIALALPTNIIITSLASPPNPRYTFKNLMAFATLFIFTYCLYADVLEFPSTLTDSLTIITACDFIQ